MRICLIGKFPPIQGGVSTQTYWSAHALAQRGHDVHVVTNAKEAVAPFRLYMRAEDWDRCEAVYGQGSVTVHWTDPVDDSQAHIPLNSPFVSKLATLAVRAHAERAFDVIISYYLEPYGVAGHLAAQMTGLPHVVRMAGSDANSAQKLSEKRDYLHTYGQVSRQRHLAVRHQDELHNLLSRHGVNRIHLQNAPVGAGRRRVTFGNIVETCARRIRGSTIKLSQLNIQQIAGAAFTQNKSPSKRNLNANRNFHVQNAQREAM